MLDGPYRRYEKTVRELGEAARTTSVQFVGLGDAMMDIHRIRRERIRRRIYFWIYVFAVIALAVLIGHNARLIASRATPVPPNETNWKSSWMPKRDVVAAMRYHGPLHRWKLTDSALMFHRGGRWIVAARRDDDR